MNVFATPYIVVALDFASAQEVRNLVAQLNPQQCRLKIGKQLFTAAGPELIKEFHSQGFSIFLDLKYHDIPNTVAHACSAAAALGVWMLNVHALGGATMLQAARNAIDNCKNAKPLLIAVTLLTSMKSSDCAELGLTGSAEEIVLRLAQLAYDNGMDGVVCSAQETAMLRKKFGNKFCLVTPGIRLENTPPHDQQRIMTPTAALTAGANYLVIGRPITAAENPAHALTEIYNQISC